MSERRVIEATPFPSTCASLVNDLRQLGVAAGDVLVVHTSMSAIGYVVGGPQAVVEALLMAVGPTGTVTMPAHSSDWSEPSHWQSPPVPEEWWQPLRDHLPAFDAHLTPLRDMGVVAEALHRLPSTVRSAHPRASHIASGPHAAQITHGHVLSDSFGEGSPLARLYELDAKILLLGVGHGNNTSIHLGESRADWVGKPIIVQGSPVLIDGQRQWITYEELDADADDFEIIGEAFGATGGARQGHVGLAMARLMSQRSLVNFATNWMSSHRTA